MKGMYRKSDFYITSEMNNLCLNTV